MTESFSRLNEPRNKRRKTVKKLVFLILGIALLFVVVRPFLVFFKSDESDPTVTAVFRVSRDGTVFGFATKYGDMRDLAATDPSVVRAAVTNSFEDKALLALRIVKRTVSPTGAYISVVKKDEEITAEYPSEDDPSYDPFYDPPKTYKTTFTLETLNADTLETVSSETVFRTEGVEQWTFLRYVLSEDKLLFESVTLPSRSFPDGGPDRYFWQIRSNGQWTREPIDFGLEGNVKVLGWEIVKETESILFLLYSEEEQKTYVSNYGYQKLSVEKTVELPSRFCFKDARLNVLSGARRFSVCRTVGESETQDTVYCAVYNTADLTEVKEFSIPGVPKDLHVDAVVIAPNLDFAAYGGKRLYLYDVRRGKSVLLRSSAPTYFKLVLSDLRRAKAENAPVVAAYAYFWSIGFTKDSETLSAADDLGNLFQWDVPTQKVKRKTLSLEY